jgi:hypothetical protein
MAAASIIIGGSGPPLPPDPAPDLVAPPPASVFELFQNGGVARGADVIFQVPYIQNPSGIGTQVEVWHQISRLAGALPFGGWMLNNSLGVAGLITLNDAGITLFTLGGPPGSNWLFAVPTFVRIVVPGGVKALAIGMSGDIVSAI